MRTTTARHDPLDAALGKTLADLSTAALWLILAVGIAITLQLL